MSPGTDAITIEVVRNELEAMMAVMHGTIQRTARSSMAKAGDFAISFGDGAGRNVGVGPQNVVTSNFQELAMSIIDSGVPIEEGDIFMMNDPYSGGSHLPDIWMTSPIFYKGERIAFAQCYSHHSDVGGRFPGSQTGMAETLFEEGIRIPLVKLEAAGVRNQPLLALAAANVRPQEEFVGDIEAKIAGLKKAGANVCEILDRYGTQAFHDCCAFLHRRSADALTAALAELPAGRYAAEAFLYDDGRGSVEQPIPVRLALEISPEGIVADFGGSAPQVGGAINMPVSNTAGVVFNALRELIVPDVPMNDGLLNRFTLRAPAGSIVNPAFPAAVAGRAPVFLVIDELAHLCMAQAMPGRVPAVREPWDVLHFSKRTGDGSQLSLMDLYSGGWGGRPDADGIDGIAPNSTTTVSAEVLEREYPLVIEGFGLVPDTAGAGRHRGSLAVFRSYRFLEEASIMTRTSKSRPSDGVDGGRAGAAPVSLLTVGGRQDRLPTRTYDHIKVKPGDRFYHQVSGAAGFGDPMQREIGSVHLDIIEGRISPAVAEQEYGVVVFPDSFAIDADATARRRGRRHAQEV